MNHSETATILAMLAAIDRRTIGESEITAWQSLLEGQLFDDCRLAVQAHYRVTRQFAMPSDIRNLAVLAANDRVAQRQAQQLREIESTTPRRPTGRIAEILGEALNWSPERREREQGYRSALTIKCPVDWCSAHPGAGCKTSHGRATLAPHPSRIDAAKAAV